MNRKHLCDLLVTNINENSKNSEVIEHAKNVLEQVENYIKSHFSDRKQATDSIQNGNLLRYMDIAEAIKDIADHKLYYAITRIWDFLLKGKNYETSLGVYELYITHSLLKGLLISSHSTTKSE